jgi:hypothetical protein
MEIKEIMTAVKLGKVHTLSPELEGICREIAGLSEEWARNIRFALLSFEEWYQRESWLESWAVLAQSAALNARTRALDDGPDLPTVNVPHAEKGDEVLEGMYTSGCLLLEAARLSEEPANSTHLQGRSGVLGALSALFRRPDGLCQRDYSKKGSTTDKQSP